MSRAVVLRALLFYLPVFFSIFHEAKSICACSEDNLNPDITEIEDYLSEINLQNVPTIKMMIGGFKCPVNALPFGSLKSDWARLLLLRDAQPEGSILKEKLETLIRILVIAYYQMEERFEVEENNPSTIDSSQRVQSTTMENQFDKNSRKLENDEMSTQTIDNYNINNARGNSTIRNNYITEYSMIEDNGTSLASVDAREEEYTNDISVFSTTLSSSIVVNNIENSSVNHNSSIEEERTTKLMESDSTNHITNIDLHNYSMDKLQENSTFSMQPEIPEVSTTGVTESTQDNYEEINSENKTTQDVHNFTESNTIINNDLNVTQQTSIFIDNTINVENTSQLITSANYNFIENTTPLIDKENTIKETEQDTINFEDTEFSFKLESSTPLTPSTSGDPTFTSNNSDCYSQFYQTETLSFDIAAITIKTETKMEIKDHTQPPVYLTSGNAMRMETSKMATELDGIGSSRTTVIDEEKNDLENHKVDDESLRLYDSTLIDFEDLESSAPEVATTDSIALMSFKEPGSGTSEVATTHSTTSMSFKYTERAASEVATTHSTDFIGFKDPGNYAPEVATTDSTTSNNFENLGSGTSEVATTHSTAFIGFNDPGSDATEVATTHSTIYIGFKDSGSDAPKVATTNFTTSMDFKDPESGAPEVAITNSTTSNNFKYSESDAPEVSATNSTTAVDFKEPKSGAPEVAMINSTTSMDFKDPESSAPEVATSNLTTSKDEQKFHNDRVNFTLHESSSLRSTTIPDVQSSAKPINVYIINSTKDNEAESKESLQNHLERVSDIFHVFKNEPILRGSKNDNRMRKLPVLRKPPEGNKFWKHVISPRFSSTTFPTFGRGFEDEFPEGPPKSRKRGSLNTDVEKSFRWFYGLGGRNNQQFGNNLYARPNIYVQCDND